MFQPFGFMNTQAGGGGGDADADAFIAAAGITDPTQEAAIQTLVVGMKADNIWNNVQAVYPFVGGTATAHKFNLKNPLDTDAAYRLSFQGTWTHDANGAKSDGADTNYADTFWEVNNDASVNEHHTLKYATIPSGTGCGYDGQGGSPYIIMGTCQALELFDGTATWSNAGSRAGGYAQGIIRTASNNVEFWSYTNSAQTWSNKKTTTNAVGTITASNYTLGKINNTGFGNDDTFGFQSLGPTMTLTEWADYFTLIQAFQTTLSRAV